MFRSERQNRTALRHGVGQREPERGGRVLPLQDAAHLREGRGQGQRHQDCHRQHARGRQGARQTRHL